MDHVGEPAGRARPRNWRSARDYDSARDLAEEWLAWEFLRRSATYGADAENSNPEDRARASRWGLLKLQRC